MEWSRLRAAGTAVAIIVIFLHLATAYDDIPCDAKEVVNRSVICRCNATYCDTLIREHPTEGEIMTYTSSRSGLRFYKQSSSFEDSVSSDGGVIFDLDPNKTYQTIHGFGGAVTDATGINYQNLSDPQLKKHLINSYCSDTGIQYSMMRVPIGGSDFSIEPYAYNEYPVDDKELSNFTLRNEDYEYKLPFIKACMDVAVEDIHVVGTCWSPPTWMKILHNYTGVNYLKDDCFQTYADYHVKFVDEYKKEGIIVWAVTTTNEPMTSIANMGKINSLGWTAHTMGTWVAYYLGPTLKKHYPDIKLLGVDDQRNTIPIWLNVAADLHPDMIKYLDGVAVHFYLNMYDTPESILLALAKYPGLIALGTEASFGSGAVIKVDWGSWERAAYYAKDIIESLKVDLIGWMDWNMAVNSGGGPAWNENYCDSPIIVKPEEGAFYKQPMFYSMGHFAKFLPRGSQRIKLDVSTNSATLYSVAALTPNNTIAVVINNWNTTEIEAILRLGDKQAKITLPPESIVTAEFSHKAD